MKERAESFSTLAVPILIKNYDLYSNTGSLKLSQLTKDIVTLNSDLIVIQIYGLSDNLLFDSTEILNNNEHDLEMDETGSALKSRLHTTEISSRDINLKDTKYLEIIQPYTDDWGSRRYVVRFIFSYSSLEKNLKSSLLSITFISLVFFIFSFSVLYIFTKKIFTDPLSSIMSIVHKVSEGDYDVRLDIQSNDEINELSDSINTMLNKIERSNKIIESQNKTLEKEVEKRMHELNKKIKELENTKLATLNILEDVDESNKELSKARADLQEKINELKLMDKKKDEFLSVTAHELKTPLTSIRGFTELLKSPKIMNNKALRQKYFEVIVEDTRRLEKLIIDILDLTKLDMGTMKFDYENTTVKEIMDDLNNLVDLSIKSKKLKSIYEYKPDLPVFITDKSRLLQVLSNIVNNAINYTEKGSIRVTVSEKGNFIVFSIEDTGLGIPKQEQDKIFQRFYQVDSSFTRKVGGSGLGLAICKGIIEAMGGKIWVKSIPEKGSVFSFMIPMKPRLEEEQTLEFFKNLRKKGYKIIATKYEFQKQGILDEKGMAQMKIDEAELEKSGFIKKA
ncbi:HAMP domain-containing protein [Candidatus Woesearchaeota archaeon]|nr:HAMP domain-containing protein [Candidatus Woesearchaeota archaeon]